jgi:mRNA-degrading endonuclease RelE of RelBE toxin-antitoxin system
MTIVKTDDFAKALERLPKNAQRLFLTQESRFRINPYDLRLHLKKVKTLDKAYSFRVTRNYRVFFYFQDNATAVFFDIDHRKDIYRKI